MRRFKKIVGREKKDKGAFSSLLLSRGREDVEKTGTEVLPVRAAEPVRLGRIGAEGFFDFRRDLGIYEVKRLTNIKGKCSVFNLQTGHF